MPANPTSEDALVEAVARATCKARGWNPDTCIAGSGFATADGRSGSECHAWLWQNCMPDARAAITALRTSEADAVKRGMELAAQIAESIGGLGEQSGFAEGMDHASERIATAIRTAMKDGP